MLKRELELPLNAHIFLLGPRQTGKTTLVKQRISEKQRKDYNLLLTQEFSKLVARPSVLREEVLALGEKITHVFLDEIQRVPDLLNEVQVLIDEGTAKWFILSGSSARKLKRNQGNLLGGRAWLYTLYPLTITEIGGESFKLGRALSFGTLPQVYTAEDDIARENHLRAYVDLYLREEIEAEALSRNIGGFIRFLSVAAQSNGEIINFSNISRDVGLSSVTVKEYFKILEDTLLGSFLFPYHQSERKRHRLGAKFYFFDTGVLRAAQKRLSQPIESGTFE